MGIQDLVKKMVGEAEQFSFKPELVEVADEALKAEATRIYNEAMVRAKASKMEQVNTSAMIAAGKAIEEVLPVVAPVDWHLNGDSSELLIGLKEAVDASNWKNVVAISAILITKELLV